MDYDKDNAKFNIIAAGPVAPASNGLLAYRYVLRDWSSEGRTEFVTHRQVFETTPPPRMSFGHGHYFVAMKGAESKALEQALDDLHERIMRDVSRYYAPTGKLVALCG